MTATDTEPVEGAASAWHLIHRGPSRRWMTVFCSLLAIVVIAAAALTYVGIETVRSSLRLRGVSVLVRILCDSERSTAAAAPSSP